MTFEERAKQWLDTRVLLPDGQDDLASLVALLEEVADEVHQDATRAEFRRGRRAARQSTKDLEGVIDVMEGIRRDERRSRDQESAT